MASKVSSKFEAKEDEALATRVVLVIMTDKLLPCLW
ncbi:hypothetical protein EC9_44920 [Rosistilla ulvae]|uniref:Uncharacterized protein n=1 Tax=Rosistilla ulvae TaxID=1930277 RepID=A0A517M5Y2_9BACT|nr:hypothetical protein EC9_44920 [Rosistilla ulvae]